MQKHELKARVDGQMDEWKRNLDVMKAKADAAQGDTKVTYSQQVAGLQKQYDELKIKAAASWDTADDKWDEGSKDLETAWDDWTDRAAKALDDFNK
jgi:hypothetical protein